jgi:hypothetical protein
MLTLLTLFRPLPELVNDAHDPTPRLEDESEMNRK